MVIGEMLDPVEITVLTYYLNADTNDIEVFWLWHGAEHRMAELIGEWGDFDNWEHSHDDGVTTAKNNELGAIIKMFKRSLGEDGSKS